MIACTSTPQVAAGSFGSSSYHGYLRVRLKNLGSGTAYLGDSGVTTAGYPLSTGDQPIEQVLLTGESLWLCSSSGATPSVAVLRLNETT